MSFLTVETVAFTLTYVLSCYFLVDDSCMDIPNKQKVFLEAVLKF